MTGEAWKPVFGYEGLYEVSDLGNVRSLDRVKLNRWGEYLKRGAVLRPGLDDKGYPMVVLTRDGKPRTRRVHVLVLEAFASPRPAGLHACHGDGDSQNNRVENLRWDTPNENTFDKIRHGTHLQAAQTHCKRGHPLGGPDSDVQIRPNGRRRCRRCERENQRMRRAGV